MKPQSRQTSNSLSGLWQISTFPSAPVRRKKLLAAKGKGRFLMAWSICPLFCCKWFALCSSTLKRSLLRERWRVRTSLYPITHHPNSFGLPKHLCSLNQLLLNLISPMRVYSLTTHTHSISLSDTYAHTQEKQQNCLCQGKGGKFWGKTLWGGGEELRFLAYALHILD